jgi:hypothetical protein
MGQESGVEREGSKGVGAMVDGQTQTQRLGRSGIWCNGLVITTSTASWEPAETLEGASEAVADFHRDHPAKPRA